MACLHHLLLHRPHTFSCRTHHMPSETPPTHPAPAAAALHASPPAAIGLRNSNPIRQESWTCCCSPAAATPTTPIKPPPPPPSKHTPHKPIHSKDVSCTDVCMLHTMALLQFPTTRQEAQGTSLHSTQST
mmetsp:Transcript_18145/g.45741  ORF Transcript_18145/g.45741 Transcript_18145/m.45741 type:complete len:130 (+) Transcript_18145:325-714(+)